VEGNCSGILKLFIAAYTEEGNGKRHSGWLVFRLMFEPSLPARLSCCTNFLQTFFFTEELLEYFFVSWGNFTWDN